MADQAHNLRQFVRNETKHGARVIAVTSGKGGVGKTNLSVNLAIALAKKGKRVALLDADLGLANVEVLLGLNSLYNLQHVITGERSLMDVIVKGPGGIHVVPGSSGIAKIADMGAKARQNVIEGLRDLQNAMDYVIVDTMAGIGQNAIAFAAAADDILLVTTPEPSSIVDAYATLKTIFQQRDDAVIRLVVNQALNTQQAEAVSKKVGHVVQQFLGRKLPYIGYIPRDPHVQQGVMQTTPFSQKFPNAPATKAVFELAERIESQKPESKDERTGFFRRIAENLGLASSA